MLQNREFLNCFWDLAVDDADKRVSACHELLQFVQQSKDTTIDVGYTVKRLINGLSSSRESARHGFCACLTSVIQANIVPVESVFELIDETTKVSIYIVANFVILRNRNFYFLDIRFS